MILGAGLAPVRELRAAGAPVGIGCDGSASADSASLWLETRGALLLGRLRSGAGVDGRRATRWRWRRWAAPRAWAASGEIGLLAPGAAGDLVGVAAGGRRLRRRPVRPGRGVAALRARSRRATPSCRDGPSSRDGVLQAPGVEERLADHRRIAGEWLAAAAG